MDMISLLFWAFFVYTVMCYVFACNARKQKQIAEKQFANTEKDVERARADNARLPKPKRIDIEPVVAEWPKSFREAADLYHNRMVGLYLYLYLCFANTLIVFSYLS